MQIRNVRDRDCFVIAIRAVLNRRAKQNSIRQITLSVEIETGFVIQPFQSNTIATRARAS